MVGGETHRVSVHIIHCPLLNHREWMHTQLLAGSCTVWGPGLLILHSVGIPLLALTVCDIQSCAHKCKHKALYQEVLLFNKTDGKVLTDVGSIYSAQWGYSCSLSGLSLSPLWAQCPLFQSPPLERLLAGTHPALIAIVFPGLSGRFQAVMDLSSSGLFYSFEKGLSSLSLLFFLLADLQ